MPAPRIFVSSTCFDLQEVRGNLRQFIQDYGYEPIMSEFGDIFYDFDINVQDSCINAIKNSDFYILIIGDYYGSFYHKSSPKIPDSVTLKEFSKALNLDKPKMIFINKFVEHDYRNYRRFLDQRYKERFGKITENLTKEEIEKQKEEIKNEFDRTYPFPKDSYKFIFNFLEKIDDLETGNAYYKFENSFEIKDMLKKQWASYFQECLSKRKDGEGKEELKKLSEKIEKIYELISSLGVGLNKTGENISLETFTSDVENSTFEDKRNLLDNLIRPSVGFYAFRHQSAIFSNKINSFPGLSKFTFIDV